ncbi:hypothetical protein LIER_41203 [Lithospermum erythrorhizon]|uniref:Pentatricopeptide repeat-containing protein n=1 Tax=Lithospermum erythrorhizon TaxID=34254 RepID=A0AAV3R9M7_LITER
MYAKFADTEKSYKVFDKMPQRDFISWNSMINCYIQNRYLLEALNMFKDMYIYGVLPKKELVASVLSTFFAEIGSIKHGKEIHGYAFRRGMDSDFRLSSALIHTYSECKEDLRTIRKVVLIRMVLHFLQLYQWYTGLVDEGKKLFDEAVKEKYSALTIEHYVCYIDLLGRAGKLEDVIDIVRKMPIEPSTKVWSSLVSACKLHERMEIAETLARELIKEEPDNDTNYKLLSMVKAERDNWHGVQKVGRNAIQ